MKKYEKRRGIAIILTMMMCLAMIPVIGLAVDGTNAYLMRARISTALDAAVLAGARSLSVGTDIPTQEGNATTFANAVFAANLANLSSNITVPVPAFTVTETAAHYRIVSASATIELPLSMMSIIGVSNPLITVTAQAERRDVNLILVLDHSQPLGGAPLATLQTDATSFVNMFANGRDNLGLVTFTGEARVPYPPTTAFLSDTQNIPYWISQMQTYRYGASNMSAGIWAAYQQLVSLNNPGALNVIVLFTGGIPNSFTADFYASINASAGCGTALADPVKAVLWSNPTSTEVGVAGLSDPTARSINDPLELRTAPGNAGCSNLVPSRLWPTYPYLGSMPTTDSYGSSTDGGGPMGEYASLGGMMTQASALTVSALAENAVDDAAYRIRGDTTLSPVIYTIGLSGLPDTQPDSTLMGRVANDPNYSNNYQSGQAAGLYLPVPTTGQLNAVFTKVASQVLRLCSVNPASPCT